MWMEERVGKRINHERIDEALTLHPDIIATACPYCQIMLSDATKDRQSNSTTHNNTTVTDIAEILLHSIHEPETAGHDEGESSSR